jgi:hypothetical protein
MLWMLVVYVVTSNGYGGRPLITSSFHGATFASQKACSSAAATAGVTPPSPGDDLTRVGLVAVCAPVDQAAAASAEPAPEAPQPQDPFPAMKPSRNR